MPLHPGLFSNSHNGRVDVLAVLQIGLFSNGPVILLILLKICGHNIPSPFCLTLPMILGLQLRSESPQGDLSAVLSPFPDTRAINLW